MVAPVAPGIGQPGASQIQPQGKKKQSGNVRKILYAKKSLKDWLDELVSLVSSRLSALSGSVASLCILLQN